MIACVFGGTGFLGRRLVRRLAAQGVSVRVAVRSTHSDAVRADVRDRSSVAAAVSGAYAVVNAVSAYDEKRDITFDSVHVHGARALAEEAAAAGVARLVLLSGIGADPQSRSPYIRGPAPCSVPAMPSSPASPTSCASFRPCPSSAAAAFRVHPGRGCEPAHKWPYAK